MYILYYIAMYIVINFNHTRITTVFIIGCLCSQFVDVVTTWN